MRVINFVWKSVSHLVTDVAAGFIIIEQMYHLISSLRLIRCLLVLTHLSSLNNSLFMEENTGTQLTYHTISTQF